MMNLPASNAKLSGPEKAALLIFGLDEDVATEILRHLDDDDLARLNTIVARGAPPRTSELERVFAEFVNGMEGPPPAPRDGAAYLHRLASAAVGDERARKLLPEKKTVTPIEALRGARPATLADLLADEHPQIAAVVIAQLPRDQAAKVLAAMPEERQADLIGRVASLKEVPAHAAQVLSDTLGKALAGEASDGDRCEFDGVTHVAGLLNEMAADVSEKLLGALDATSDLAPKVREKMFTFEDLLRIPSRALQVLMRELPADSLLVSLKTASEGLREHFLGAVSSRAAAQLREDLSLLPPTRLSDVERAQKEIIEIVQRLAAEGKITMPGRASEAMV
jgi:flagellar motor switch protein FliG